MLTDNLPLPGNKGRDMGWRRALRRTNSVRSRKVRQEENTFRTLKEIYKLFVLLRRVWEGRNVGCKSI